jgi:hypothetical protein
MAERFPLLGASGTRAELLVLSQGQLICLSLILLQSRPSALSAPVGKGPFATLLTSLNSMTAWEAGAGSTTGAGSGSGSGSGARAGSGSGSGTGVNDLVMQ